MFITALALGGCTNDNTNFCSNECEAAKACAQQGGKLKSYQDTFNGQKVECQYN